MKVARHRRSSRGTAIVTAFALVLVGCGGQRSTEAFCDELDRGMQALYDSADTAAEGENPMLGLLVLAGSLGDLQRLLERLADVAPEEIRRDMEVTRDVMGRQMDRAGEVASDPLAALAGSLGDSLMNQGSFTRVDTFARQECGQPVFGP